MLETAHGVPSVRFDIYLAYASADRAFAEELHRLLEPRCRVLFDRNLAPGTLWDMALPEALQASRTIVVLVSKQSMSHWYFASEIAQAVNLARTRPGVKIIPVVLDGSELPFGLERVQAIDAVAAGGVEGVAGRILESVTRRETEGAMPAEDGRDVSNPPVLFGREREIDTLTDLLAKPRPGRNIIAIDGMGGVGKTALAAEVEHRARASGLFAHFIWQTAKTEVFDGSGAVRLSGETPVITVGHLLQTIAREAGFASRLNEESTLAEKIYLARRLMETERCLVVVDNLETVRDFRRLVSELAPLFTGSQALLTSRFSLAEYDFVQTIPLGPLSVEAGLALLRNELRERSPLQPVTIDDEDLRRIHGATGGLPLAMKLIAGRIVSTIAPLDRLLEQIHVVDWNDPESVYRQLYDFIFQDICKSLPEPAQLLLSRMSVLPPVLPIALADVQAISGQERSVFERALEDLVRASLVERRGDRGTPHCALHPLTHRFASRLLDGAA